jgi:hypothetical protein
MTIEEIKARAAAATPGPWKSKINGNTVRSYGIISQTRKICSAISTLTADAEFIAHARTDIPDLIAEVERLQSLCQKLIGEEGIFQEKEALIENLRSDNARLQAENKRLTSILKTYGCETCIGCECEPKMHEGKPKDCLAWRAKGESL